MNYDYSENILIQESAGNLLKDELDWEVKYAYNTEKLGVDGTFGRKTYKEILLYRYLKNAVMKLNPWLTDELYDDMLKMLEHHLASSSLMQVNEEKYTLLRDGIPVTVKKPDGKTEQQRVMIFDFKKPLNNHFLAIKELKIHGDLYRRRTDIVGFVNGIPLLFIELKKNTVDIQNAYTDNYTDYLDTIPHLFYYNAFLMLSNGLEAKVGTLGSKYEFFHEWKRLNENDIGSVELETMLRGICNKETFMDLFENFILYDHSGGNIVKILSRNHQYLGVNEAVEAYRERKFNNGKLGVFWHTQGSGKSYSMLFLAQKIRRKFKGSPTILVLTDRDDLNTQISDTFENCGVLGNVKASQYIASSGNDLITKLKSNPSFIFTLIQKFNKPDETPIQPNYDIIIMSDEAHRSQYGVYADNMCALLPTASRIGFTGTPLFSSDNITERTFGQYVSVYDFTRAVEDGATVPLYYENRSAQLKDIEKPEINEKIAKAIEDADLDINQQEKLEKEFAKEIHLLTADYRLDTVAHDFVEHYTSLWTSGKAMFVCINKVTCVRMYNFVQEYWKTKIDETEKMLKDMSQQEAQEINRKLQWLRETEMCVVISQEQNEIQTFNKWQLDIKPHREKMEKRELDREFKDSKNPFRVVFVCAMWLTGFDVKSLSCLYLDKPLTAHTLMQAIARANRVSEGKSNGLIVDYIGVVKALRKALADYTIDKGGSNSTDPTIDKSKLIERILTVITETDNFMQMQGFKLKELVDAKDFTKLALIKAGADAMCASMEIKKTFQTYASELNRLMKYALRDDISGEKHQYKDAIMAVFNALQEKRKNADNVDLMVLINSIISDYVQVESSANGIVTSKQFDISKIDFDLLRAEFSKSRTKNLMMRDLDELIRQRLDNMIVNNPLRINYYERYCKIIENYNNEQDWATIEKTFMNLMALANQMSNEEQRFVREGFNSDDELSIYDLIFKESLSQQEIKTIKKVAVDLLSKIRHKIKELDHWTDKSETKAAIDNLIRDTLWSELPESYDEITISEYRQKVYEFVYLRYKEVA